MKCIDSDSRFIGTASHRLQRQDKLGTSHPAGDGNDPCRYQLTTRSLRHNPPHIRMLRRLPISTCRVRSVNSEPRCCSHCDAKPIPMSRATGLASNLVASGASALCPTCRLPRFDSNTRLITIGTLTAPIRGLARASSSQASKSADMRHFI